MRMAPWRDFSGNPIREGDTIQHPSGQSGCVVYHGERDSDDDRWCVSYNDSFESRLCLQIGDKGMATVIAQPL